MTQRRCPLSSFIWPGHTGVVYCAKRTLSKDSNHVRSVDRVSVYKPLGYLKYWMRLDYSLIIWLAVDKNFFFSEINSSQETTDLFSDKYLSFSCLLVL